MSAKYWLPVGLCALCHCTGTETGNPVRDEDVGVAFAPLRATVLREQLGEVVFDSVAIQVTSLAMERCGGGELAVLFQDRSVDLLSGEVNDVRIPAGTYCAVRLGMGSASDSFAAGRMTSGGQTRLTFESQLRTQVRLSLLEPLVTRGTQPAWIFGVDLAAWLSPIDDWLDGDDPQLKLDGPQTAALRQAQARSLRLYRDESADGQLDAQDIEAPLSAAGVLQRE